jgi:hypothetical protein
MFFYKTGPGFEEAAGSFRKVLNSDGKMEAAIPLSGGCRMCWLRGTLKLKHT